MATKKKAAKKSTTVKRQKTGGRQKGASNKTTTAVKEAILKAFSEVGGYKYLKNVAKSDPKTFCTLLGRVLPNEVKASLEHSGLNGEPLITTPIQIEIINTSKK